MERDIDVQRTGRLRLEPMSENALRAASRTTGWIVNLVDRVLEIHREPARLDAPDRRWGYRSIEALGPGGSVSPLVAPGARVAVADLLP